MFFRTDEQLSFVELLTKRRSPRIPIISHVHTDAPPGDQQCRLPTTDGHDCSVEERKDLRDGNIPGTARSQGSLR